VSTTQQKLIKKGADDKMQFDYIGKFEELTIRLPPGRMRVEFPVLDPSIHKGKYWAKDILLKDRPEIQGVPGKLKPYSAELDIVYPGPEDFWFERDSLTICDAAGKEFLELH